MRFASTFDERAFHDGPAAIFTPDPRGNLRIDPERTREMWLQLPEPHAREAAIYLLRDAVTGVQMLLATNAPAFVLSQPRGVAERQPDYDTALSRQRSQWSVAPSGPASHATGGLGHPPAPPALPE